VEPSKFTDNEEEQEIRKSPSPRNRLTKEDLKPFFDSQKSQEERKND
jgi:hypothetical protein